MDGEREREGNEGVQSLFYVTHQKRWSAHTAAAVAA